jgi:NAD(P)-dependent dehydrogenase (short-subunit alcohol dehydrogenase family)
LAGLPNFFRRENPDMSFAGKSVLISGAASGIGLACAKMFASLGGYVTMVDINGEGLADKAGELVAQGFSVSTVVADVASPEACYAMVSKAVASFGRLDIAINNAGIPTDIGDLFEDIPVAKWRRVIDVNLNGLFYAMRAEVPAIKAAGGGAIVNTASVASVVAAKGMAAYIASKHGVAGLTKAAALDVIEHGIRVNAVCPGFVDTGMTAPLKDDRAAFEALSAATPIGRIAKAEEIANAIVWLASDAASYAVGQMMALDGGVVLS